ncbi:hypothetical protein B5807_02546 [Epicoccum nigrum]|uniref:Uncharacterized protein n=1 Tax=Epicoccum nigrum TaxID=105696 RepID=A0A1Y2M8Y7_EPING|nr:hypothetical protein B5807_02546 [Epicoccum nigrum]
MISFSKLSAQALIEPTLSGARKRSILSRKEYGLEAIRTKEDLSGKDALEKKEKASLDALKAKNLKERAIHVLQLQTVKGLVVSAEADQDQLKAYKAAVVAIKMPKAV